jgi:ABC-type branched-subunit amino acid transport system ATPase component
VERAVAHADRYYVLDGGRVVLSGQSTSGALEQIGEIVLGTTAVGTHALGGAGTG